MGMGVAAHTNPTFMPAYDRRDRRASAELRTIARQLTGL
jgi:hypothetical protein